MDIDSELREQTAKWLGRLEQRMEGLQAESRTGPVMDNVKAYMSDCKHFQEEGDLVRAFEAVVYAWGLLEALEHLNLIPPRAVQ